MALSRQNSFETRNICWGICKKCSWFQKHFAQPAAIYSYTLWGLNHPTYSTAKMLLKPGTFLALFRQNAFETRNIFWEICKNVPGFKSILPAKGKNVPGFKSILPSPRLSIAIPCGAATFILIPLGKMLFKPGTFWPFSGKMLLKPGTFLALFREMFLVSKAFCRKRAKMFLVSKAFCPAPGNL